MHERQNDKAAKVDKSALHFGKNGEIHRVINEMCVCVCALTDHEEN